MFLFIKLSLGPLLCENLDVRGIAPSLGTKLTIALCGMVEKASQVLFSSYFQHVCSVFLVTFTHSSCTL